MKLLAMVPVFNEADILEHSLRKLLEKGIEVAVFDNHSTDESREIAEALGVEIHTYGRPDRWKVEEMVSTTQRFARRADADWLMLHAADEIFESNQFGETYLAAVTRLAAEGANTIDHALRVYVPIDNDFEPGTDHEIYFRHWSDDTLAHKRKTLHVRAWKQHPQVNLISRTHNISLPEKQLAEEKLILKHYPIRSQQHGERKVLKERFGRGEKMSFSQYKKVRETKQFLHGPVGLNVDP